MNTFRYDGPSQISVTRGGGGFASASLALTIMLAVSACSTPPYPRKLLSEIRAEEAANQLSLQSQPAATQPEVLETAAGPIDAALPSAPPADLEIAAAEQPRADLASRAAPDTASDVASAAPDLVGPEVVPSEASIDETPLVTAAAETLPDEGGMTVLADEIPPEVTSDQPQLRASFNPDLTEETQARTATAPTGRIETGDIETGDIETGDIETGDFEIVPSEASIDESPLVKAAAETVPDEGRMTVLADETPPEVITDQPPARAWVNPDLIEETEDAKTATVPTGGIEASNSETGDIETGGIETVATETPLASPDPLARPEPAFDIATLDPMANRRLDAAPSPERDLPATEVTAADPSVAEETTADLPAPPEARREVAALVTAPSPDLASEPTALPLPSPKTPALRQEPKAAHHRRRSVPGEAGLIELEQTEASRVPAQPAPALITPAVTAEADPVSDDTVTKTEDAPQLTGSQTSSPEPQVMEPQVTEPQVTEPQVTEPQVTETMTQFEEPRTRVTETMTDPVKETSVDDRARAEEQTLPSLPVAQVEHRPVVAVPSDAPQLASTTANLPRAIEPRAPLTGLQVPFAPGSSALSDEARSSLTNLAEQLDVTSSPRLRLSAFAAAGDLANGMSRRLSLSRLFAVRDFLIEWGLRSEDIDLMPMAGTEGETPIDRVELEIDHT